MNAMTWFDHETDSIWSQPIGTALGGDFEGVRLEMIPVNVVPWATWKNEHPDTLVLTTELEFTYSSKDPFESFRGNYVVGVAVGDLAKSYAFRTVSKEVVVNDRIGDLPVLVYANPDSRSVHVFTRVVDDIELVFEWVDGRVKDRDTGTLWDPTKGFAVEGPLKGKLLRELPYSTAYDWAWEDFYPYTEVYKP